MQSEQCPGKVFHTLNNTSNFAVAHRHPKLVIAGEVSLVMPVVVSDSTVIDTAASVNGRVIAVDPEGQIIAESSILDGNTYEIGGLPQDDYRLYVEVEANDGPLSIAVDEDEDDVPDRISVDPGASLTGYNVVIEDIELKDEAPGTVLFDGNPEPENQEVGEIRAHEDDTVKVALYGSGVQDLTRFEAVVEYDSDQLQFVDFDMPIDGEEIALLATGDQDQAIGARKQPVVERQGADVTVQENQIRIHGKMLDGRAQNAVSGGGLFGLISFIKTGTPKLAKMARGQGIGAEILLKEITLYSVGGKKTIEDAATIAITDGGPSPDFNGDGEVGFKDFILFAQVYGAKRGDGRYEGKFDLDSNDEIGFQDFILFAMSYGK